MQESTKKTLIVGGSILLATAGLFLVGRAILANIKSRKEDEIAGLTEQEEGSGTTATTPAEEADAKNYNPATDAKYIYDKLWGWKVPFVSYDTEINALIAKLTDAKLKKLADYFKSKYKKSLYLTLEEEWDYYSGNQYKGSMARLSNLGKR
jgi:hypothetical protein